MKKLMQTLCLAFFAGILAACGDETGPEKTAKAFFEELFSGDASKAAELVYIPPELSSSKDIEMLKGKLAIMANELQKKVKEEGNISVDTNEIEATVKVTLKFKKDRKEESKSDNVQLIKTDKGWRIQMK